MNNDVFMVCDGHGSVCVNFDVSKANVGDIFIIEDAKFILKEIQHNIDKKITVLQLVDYDPISKICGYKGC